MTKISAASLVATVSGSMQMPTGETGDKAISVDQIRNYVNLVASGTVSAANLKTCGSVPVVLISAPGANKYLSVGRVVVSYNAGGVAFNFSSEVVFKSVGGDSQFVLSGDLNNTTDMNFDLIKQGQKNFTNVNYVLTTADASDATLGDGDIDWKIWYSIEDKNT